jgi:hypothetical protein
MARADWDAAAAEIMRRIQAQGRDKSLRTSLDDLLALLDPDNEPSEFRTRGQWASLQRGDQYWIAFRKAGLVLGFEPDETGRDVESVIFRIDRWQLDQQQGAEERE